MARHFCIGCTADSTCFGTKHKLQRAASVKSEVDGCGLQRCLQRSLQSVPTDGIQMTSGLKSSAPTVSLNHQKEKKKQLKLNRRNVVKAVTSQWRHSVEAFTTTNQTSGFRHGCFVDTVNDQGDAVTKR
jgi:hypothetical protein